jgi:hypothetical protein
MCKEKGQKCDSAILVMSQCKDKSPLLHSVFTSAMLNEGDERKWHLLPLCKPRRQAAKQGEQQLKKDGKLSGLREGGTKNV